MAFQDQDAFDNRFDTVPKASDVAAKRKSDDGNERPLKKPRFVADYGTAAVDSPTKMSYGEGASEDSDEEGCIEDLGSAPFIPQGVQQVTPAMESPHIRDGAYTPEPGEGYDRPQDQAIGGATPDAEETVLSTTSRAGDSADGDIGGRRPSRVLWKRSKLVGSSLTLARNAGFPRPVLCSGCEDLKLSFDKFVIDNRRSTGQRINGRPGFWGKRRMGTFQEIEQRTSCPLCKMLIRSAKDTPTQVSTPEISKAVCKLYWTVDGRERVPRYAQEGIVPVEKTEQPGSTQQPEPSNSQQQKSQVRTVKRTRRLAIEWTHRADVSYIVLVAPDGKFTVDGRINKGEWERPTLFLGRLLTGLDQTNWDKIKEWQQICIDHHTTDCVVPGELRERFDTVLRQSPFFRVIDVEKMCLTSLPEDEDQDVRYTALSYTWGEETRVSGGHGPSKSKTKPRFKATQENHKRLMRDNGIRDVLDSLPTSIQHAINLTEHLGIRYLWVDSLCIVQDSTRSWTLNANVMDVVYSNAEVTICAADGDGDDEIGLKALFPSDRYTRHAEEHTIDYPAQPSPLKLILSRPSESYIARTRWNTRAWTFQERLLSRRSLIFVAGRVYFQCRSTTMSEDIYSEEAKAGWSVELQGAPAQTLNGLSTNPVSVYKDCLGMYTSRELSYERDILAAFGGIANIIRSSLAIDCNPIFGLPPSHFDYALLWEPEEQPTRRVVTGKHFPSWSWCGWKDKRICYKPATVSGLEIDLHEWLLNHTWIAYYIRDGQGDLRLIWDPRKHKSNCDIDSRWAGYDSPQEGLPGGSKMKLDDVYPKFDYHGRPFNRSTPKRGRVEHSGKQFFRKYGEYMSHVKVLKPGEGPRALDQPLEDESILQFWTWSAVFYLGEEAAGEPFNNGEMVGAGLKRFAILDADGDFAGTCVLSEVWTSAAREDKPQTFIALSDAREFDGSEYGCWSFYNEHQGDTNPWQLYNVMMLCNEEGVGYTETKTEVAYRAGLGKVYKSAFDYGMNKENWKEIILG
ncbi:Hypothetical predicted protein [Lecanosticta acicola]|uniref:Heterokaryon incompatibility domain-containing protein n=1 Tax=Lecanosticta acicola TaxID=111012 RepID=A0AAI8Z5E6_9PEZI|nr:Hypothetical predicted protein [Lecanosticta acicola]